MNDYDVVVIGAGAAGLMAASVAGKRGKRVLVLDHNEEPGRKILISGGGRCNFTNLECKAENFLSANPHYAKSALKRFSQFDFLSLVGSYGIAWHEREHGQLFCDDSARQIVDMLMAECGQGGVEFGFSIKVGDISGDGPYTVETSAGPVTAPAMIVATGGLSIWRIGSTGYAHGVASRYGLGLTELRPALVPLTFGAEDSELIRPLAGIATDAVVSCGKGKFREALLFTHRGLSGPAILQASSYWREKQPITVNLLPDMDVQGWLLDRKQGRPKAELKTVVAEMLPARLAHALVERAGLTGRPMIEIGNKALAEMAELLSRWTLYPNGTEGYRTAEVTLGGVDTADLSSKTMESRAHPGLYFVGEAVDVTGWLGGFNFQWAWSSGWVAGMSV